MQKVYKLAVKFSYFTALKGAIVCHEADVDPHRFSLFNGNWSEFHNRYILIQKTLQVETILSQRQNFQTILQSGTNRPFAAKPSCDILFIKL